MVKHHLWKLIVAVALAATLTAPGVSATSMVFQSPPPVPPPNDNFASATVIASLPFSDTVDMSYSTTEANEPQYYCNWVQKTVWYSYTPSESQAVKVTLSGFYDTNLVVFQAYGPGIADLSYINCGSWGSPSLTFNASAGTTYYFQVGSIYGSGGTVQLNVETPPPPANDNFSDAAVISGTDFYQSVDASAATTEPGEPGSGCYSNPQQTIWYAYTPPENGVVTTHMWAQYTNDTTLNVLRADNSGIDGLTSVGCTMYDWSTQVPVKAGITYYFQAGTTRLTPNILQFYMTFTPAPANDNFADALVITGLPYDGSTDMTAASREDSEPTPSCGATGKTVWYAYKPAASGSLSQRTDTWPYTVVGVYTGSSVNALQEVVCLSRYSYDTNFLTFHADANTTYYFQLGTNESNSVPFYLQVAEPPYPNFGVYPPDPNVFDTVHFENWSWDPANAGISSILWDFGDGTTAIEPWSPDHHYAKDGDYTVKLTVTTTDGRTASMTQTAQVKTHDVAITKFTAPQSASVGQTRQLVVGINSKIYAENVRVEFFKSVPGGYTSLGYQDQSVPVRSANRTTNFQWSYTFTKDDATIGKVTFKAVATILNARDALPADNESIASPTKVAKK
jgi:hypothetical protein